jgi:hypothetical protein
MPTKTKTILIITFIIVLIGLVFGYFYITKNNSSSDKKETLGDYLNFNPFGSSKDENGGESPSVTNNQIEDIFENENQKSSFVKLTDFAISGAVFFEDIEEIKEEIQNTSSTTKQSIKTVTIPSLRYVEKATGHIYQRNLASSTVKKISNTTIPNIQEAFFDKNGMNVLLRFLSSDENTINSYLAKLGGQSGEFLPLNILNVSLSPEKDKLFYMVKKPTGVTGTVKDLNDIKSSVVFNHDYSEWISEWVTPEKIYLTTKASASFYGNVYSMNIKNGVLTKIFGNIPGLTTLSNKDGSVILYNKSSLIGPKLNIFNVNNKTIDELNIYGLPEKCVWSSNKVSLYCAVPNTVYEGEYPDIWYKGIVSFDDYFIKIDTNTGDFYTIANSTKETPIDATNLFLNKDENALFFTNKKDYTLWMLEI